VPVTRLRRSLAAFCGLCVSFSLATTGCPFVHPKQIHERLVCYSDVIVKEINGGVWDMTPAGTNTMDAALHLLSLQQLSRVV
jgi:hypothetical protein